MPYKTDLEKHIRESYHLILEYDKDLRLAVEALERARAQKVIDELWTLIKGYLNEYIPLCERLQLNVAADLKEIVARFPEYNALQYRNTFEIFFSYAHEDELLRDELAKQLSLLKRQGLINAWYDRQISPGTLWTTEIDEHLNAAHIVLLLISPDFMVSNYCYDIEMQRALERDETGEARVIPIILRPTDYMSAPFAKLQVLPKDGLPVTLWRDTDEAFLDIARGIRKVVEDLRINS
jgi:hypothetical protein